AAGGAAHRVVADLVVVEDRVARGEGVDGDAGAGGDGLEVAVNLGRVVPHGGVLHGEGAVGGDAPAFDHRRALAQRGADGDGLVVVDRAVAVERHGALVLDAAAGGAVVGHVGGPGEVLRHPQVVPGEVAAVEKAGGEGAAATSAGDVDDAAAQGQVTDRQHTREVVLEDGEVRRARRLGAGDGGAVAVDRQARRRHADGGQPDLERVGRPAGREGVGQGVGAVLGQV